MPSLLKVLALARFFWYGIGVLVLALVVRIASGRTTTLVRILLAAGVGLIAMYFAVGAAILV